MRDQSTQGLAADGGQGWADMEKPWVSDCPLRPMVLPWQRMVKNLEKELVLLKQELAIHDSLVRARGLGQAGCTGAGGRGQVVRETREHRLGARGAWRAGGWRAREPRQAGGRTRGRGLGQT